MENDFKKWMESLGFNGKEVAKAGALIGLSDQVSGHRNRGEKDLTPTERLAMSAVVAGLPPWETATAREIETVARILKPIQEALSERSAPPRMAASGHRVPEA